MAIWGYNLRNSLPQLFLLVPVFLTRVAPSHVDMSSQTHVGLTMFKPLETDQTSNLALDAFCFLMARVLWVEPLGRGFGGAARNVYVCVGGAWCSVCGAVCGACLCVLLYVLRVPFWDLPGSRRAYQQIEAAALIS